MVRFCNSFQHESKKLSAYLLRLDKLLHAVLRKGEIEVVDMNRARIEQVASGALSHDLATLLIRMTYKLKAPPSFTELLREVREEEEMILERLSVKNVGSLAPRRNAECVTASITPAQPVSAPDPAIKSLKKEFQGLKNNVARLFSASVAASEGAPQPVAQTHNQKADGNSYARG